MWAAVEVSRAGYDAWRERPDRARTTTNAALFTDIRVHQDSGARGRQPTGPCRAAGTGTWRQRGRIECLMHRHGIGAIMARPHRVADSRHGLPIAPNLIDRNFRAAAANRIWLADITYVRLQMAAVPGGDHGHLSTAANFA